MKTRYIIAIAAAALMLAGCQRESLVADSDVQYDGKISYAPGVAGIGSGSAVGVRSGLTDGSAVIGSESLTLRSADGRFTIPMTLTVTGAQAADVTSGAPTKSTLINETGALKSLGDFAASIGNTFWVAAWDMPDDGDPSQCIPDDDAKAFTGYVSGDEVNGFYQMVMYRTEDAGGEALATPYWMTVQPGSAASADDEYKWKKNEAEKTFYAYANVPAGATVAQLNDEGTLKQTLTCTGVPTQDILMGYYSGDGSTVSSEDRTGTASIHFYHPLTAVKFLAGDLADGAEITGISIENVYGGSTKFKVTQEGPDFTWAKSDGPLGASDATSDVSVSLSTDEADNPVLLIPQTFSAASKSRICVTIAQGGETFNVYTTLDDATWKAGYINTYTIGYNPPEEDEPLPGKFSISATEYAQFSRGNLQATYHSSGSYTWAIAKNQYDYVGNAVGNTTIGGQSDGAVVDLFGWTAAGKYNDGIQQYGINVSLSYPDYYIDGDDKCCDWGKTIGSKDIVWSVLSNEDWNYLVNTRKIERSGTADAASGFGNTCQWVKYNGVSGILIYPDEYDGTKYAKNAEIGLADFPSDCVFLPAAGIRNGSSMDDAASGGRYWSNTVVSTNYAYSFDFTQGGTSSAMDRNRYAGQSVRLVQRFEKPEPPVLLSGKFSVSATDYVQFTRGNLFSTDNGGGKYEFDFERYQYDFRTRNGYNNAKWASGGFVKNGTPDKTSGLFLWDIHHTGDFGAFESALESGTTSAGDSFDWGDAVTGGYSTLSATDFEYILTGRENASNLLKPGTVNGVYGCLIAPDGYSKTLANSYSGEEWIKAENEGIVFLPAAGYSANGQIASAGVDKGYIAYYTSTASNGSQSRYFVIYEPNLWKSVGSVARSQGLAVRLVQRFSKSEPEPELLQGEFSVSPTEYVRFSKGNLQYQAGDGTSSSPAWRFAEHQYDCIGKAAGNNTSDVSVRSTQADWIDLFGWGATGRNSFVQQPYSISTTDTDYKTGATATAPETLSRANGGDWGVCMGDDWLTLSRSDMEWLLGKNNVANPGINCRTSSTVSGQNNARYLRCKINNIIGLIIFPDVFTWPTGEGAPEQPAKAYINDNDLAWSKVPNYSVSQFKKLESAGVVFLPASAGYRTGVAIYNTDKASYYWLSTASSNSYADFLRIADNNTSPAYSTGSYRHYGRSVRLVQRFDKPIEREFVDLGLPSGLKWATMNIGATKPEDYGEYFAWGEVKGHKPSGTGSGAFTSDFASFDHSDARYKDCWDASECFAYMNTPYQTQNTPDGLTYKFTKYLGSTTSLYKDPSATDEDANKTVLDPGDDAAHVNWGGSWRMPTKADFDELVANTDNEWITDYKSTGISGYIFTNKNDLSKFIFLPAAGHGVGDGLVGADSYGGYRLSTLNTEDPCEAYYLGFLSTYVMPMYESRWIGQPVRPVKDVE